MARGALKEPFQSLEKDIAETLRAGFGGGDWPESYSDLQGGVRALLRMYEIKRRPIALDSAEIFEPLARCDRCEEEACSFQSAKKLCYTHMKEAESDAGAIG